jgi:hypothetical protein
MPSSLGEVHRLTLHLRRLYEEPRRIRGGHKVEPLRWRGRTGVLIVPAVQQGHHVLEWPSFQADVDHGTDQHPNHVMKKAVSLDVEAHASAKGSLLPFGANQPAAIMKLVALRSESLEIVLAGDGLSRRAEELEVERLSECPFEGSAKR